MPPLPDTADPAPVVRRRLPARLEVVLVCASVLPPLERHLQVADGEEEAAWLTGYLAARAGVITSAFLPCTRRSAGGVEIPEDTTYRMSCRLRRLGMFLICQCHTHPGQPFHSWTDDAYAVQRPGLFSIVIPCAARFGLKRIFDGESAIYECMPDGDWRSLNDEEIRRRFILIDSFYGAW